MLMYVVCVRGVCCVCSYDVVDVIQYKCALNFCFVCRYMAACVVHAICAESLFASTHRSANFTNLSVLPTSPLLSLLLSLSLTHTHTISLSWWHLSAASIEEYPPTPLILPILYDRAMRSAKLGDLDPIGDSPDLALIRSVENSLLRLAGSLPDVSRHNDYAGQAQQFHIPMYSALI
eukprot:Opistho-2@8123